MRTSRPLITLTLTLALLTLGGTLWAQERRFFIPNVALTAPKLSAQRAQQLRATKRRGDLSALRAATSRAADGTLKYRISPTKTVTLLDEQTLAQQRSITPSLRPASQQALDRYKDYVDGKASGAPTPAQVSLKRRQSPVKDQQQRGTCVAFAIVAAMEAAYNANGQLVDLSEEDAYWTLKAGRSCQSGTFLEFFQLAQLSANGVSTERDWPYRGNPAELGCPRATVSRPAQAAQNAKWAPSTFWSIPRGDSLTQDTGVYANNPRQIESWLATGHEVYIAVSVAGDLSQRGVIDVLLDERGELTSSWAGHAMLIVGYDKANGGTFEVKNSWGTQAGDGGYIKLSYDYIRVYARQASILIELRDVARSQENQQRIAQPQLATPQAPQANAAAAADRAIGAMLTAPAGLSAAQLARIRSLGAQLKQDPTTKAQAASLEQCVLVERRKEGVHDYDRVIPVWEVSLIVEGSAQRFECRGGGRCISYKGVQGSPALANKSWVHASFSLSGTPAQTQAQSAQAASLWRQLIAACSVGGDKA